MNAILLVYWLSNEPCCKSAGSGQARCRYSLAHSVQSAGDCFCLVELGCIRYFVIFVVCVVLSLCRMAQRAAGARGAELRAFEARTPKGCKTSNLVSLVYTAFSKEKEILLISCSFFLKKSSFTHLCSL